MKNRYVVGLLIACTLAFVFANLCMVVNAPATPDKTESTEIESSTEIEATTEIETTTVEETTTEEETTTVAETTTEEETTTTEVQTTTIEETTTTVEETTTTVPETTTIYIEETQPAPTVKTLDNTYPAEVVDLLYRVVQAEIGGASYEAKLNVASVIFNRVKLSDTRDLYGVLTAPTQFSVVGNGMIWGVTPDQDTINACNVIFNNGEYLDTTSGCYFFDSKGTGTYASNHCEKVFFDGWHYFYR